jgi:formylglycine-generating enzyme required for sulfatase activity
MSASATRQVPGAAGAAPFRFLLTHRRRTQGFREALGADDATSLTMLWIPPGRFLMGSPAEEPERSGAEGPQHLVQLQGFFLAQTPITQAQWRLVAQWRPNRAERAWNRKLDPNPSRFSGDHRPVEGVSWDDAMEFCHRLSRRTGRIYTLPSEAQWDYACRAGTTTPFHCGSTISTKLANYDGTKVYGDGEKGEFRQQTTDVTTFPANTWGLYDMQGNVCLNILRADWKPVLGMNTVILGLIFLFIEPNPDDPLNHEAAQLMRTNEYQFREKVTKTMRGGMIDGASFTKFI